MGNHELSNPTVRADSKRRKDPDGRLHQILARGKVDADFSGTHQLMFGFTGVALHEALQGTDRSRAEVT